MLNPNRLKKWAPYFGVFLLGTLILVSSARVQHLLGGVFVNFAYRLQDHVEEGQGIADLDENSPGELLKDLESQNRLASNVRKVFPRSVRHPSVALLVCMDARIDTTELVGDTRRIYYTLRTAGSVLPEVEQDMLELAVRNGVNLVVLTTHSECAAEKAAQNPEQRALFPSLVKEVGQRDQRIQEFLHRPTISARVKSGELKVVSAAIDTATGRFLSIREL